ncbi:hypothetical protein M2406_005311 [Serratia sp. BIGb0163]|nr:hypothetical protein [Serratia sp. BIGb0163]
MSAVPGAARAYSGAQVSARAARTLALWQEGGARNALH